MSESPWMLLIVFLLVAVVSWLSVRWIITYLTRREMLDLSLIHI